MSPIDAVTRIFLEQWITFPRFVLSGAWIRALRGRSDWTRTRQLLHTNILAVAQLTSALVPAMVGRSRRGAQYRIGRRVYSPAECGRLRRQQALHHRIQRICTRRSCGNRRHRDTGVPGPVDSEFDAVAGSAGGMIGGPPRFLRIGAAQCAREALAGFERGAALVFPGRAFRSLMRALPFFPLALRRRQAANVAIRTRTRQ
jgi:uncharacterized protein